MSDTSERERFSRLLIVEDDPAQLRTLTSILQKEGFDVIGASTAAEALEHVEREDFGVAVVDLRLPDLPGTQLLQKINAMNGKIRVIINTAYGSFESAKMAVNAGAHAYVEKARNPDELVRQVHAASRWHLDRYAKDLEEAVAERTSELGEANKALRAEMAERKRSEEALRESEERFQMLFERAPLGYQSLDLDGRFIEVNQAWLDQLGYTRDEVLGRWFGDFLAPDHVEHFRENFPCFQAAGRIRGIEFAMVHKDGSRRIMSFDGNIGRDEQGNFKQTHCILKDITEQKRAEEELREKTRTNQILLDAFPCIALLLRPQSREIVAANKAAIRVGAIPGAKCFETWAQREDPCSWCLAPQVWEKGKAQHLEVESMGIMWDAHWIPVSDNLYMHFAFDITESKRAEAEKAELEAQLQQAQKMEAIGQLAGGVAHDFNNLLTVVLGNVERLKGPVGENEDGRSSLAAICDAATQASELTRSLLTFGQRTVAEKRPVDLCNLVEESARLLGRLLPASVKLVTETECDPTPWVSADQTLLKQVILNLAINARDAMPGGGTLSISVLPGDQGEPGEESWDSGIEMSSVRLVVSDTGAGMVPEVRSRIFEPFFTTKPRGQATGLGLALVHGIVTNHGGRIEVDSEVDEGTTFTIYLPCTSSDQAEPAPHSSGEPGRGNGELVLLAEGNPQLRGILCSTLRSQGYEVTAVGDGTALLATLEARGEEVRLVIVADEPPQRPGFDCLPQIRREDAAIPVILITRDESIRSEDELDALTVLLCKPFPVTQLVGLVGEMIAEHFPQETLS